jgi:anion-transporting  ArsA/GET3 family ATPase
MEKTNYTPVMFFLGPGGVGKSTVSAIKAIEQSMCGKKVLVATFDPSPRLKDILAQEKGFINNILKENLKVVILDSREIFEKLLENVDKTTAVSIKKNKLFKHLIERIQGVQEFSSLYFLSENVKINDYDLILIDTPPLQNSVDFFSSPQKLKDLFESTIVKLFIGDFNSNWFEKVFKKTRDIAFSTLKKLTGIDFFEQLIDFMKALEKLQPIILKTLNESQNILFSKTTEYSLVTSYEIQGLKNIEQQRALLKTKGISFSSLYINKYENILIQDLTTLKELSDSHNLKSLSNFIKNKMDAIESKKQILQKISELNEFKLFTLDLFKSSEIKESDLILKSGEICEYSP